MVAIIRNWSRQEEDSQISIFVQSGEFVLLFECDSEHVTRFPVQTNGNIIDGNLLDDVVGSNYKDQRNQRNSLVSYTG